MCAETRVYLVNNITCFDSYVKNNKKALTEYDFPEPR